MEEGEQQVKLCETSKTHTKKLIDSKIANFFASAKARIVGFVDSLLFGNENIVAVPA